MKTVILCGGKGTRLGADGLPKALMPIGDKPILWHIMRLYSCYGMNEFVLCLGYKGGAIREYFSKAGKAQGWKIHFLDTGLDTNTGGRLYKAKEVITDDTFCVTYGDGLSDVDIAKLIVFHRRHKKAATLTAVKPCSPFGIIGIETASHAVTHFDEKPVLDHWVNGGFFVFNKEIFSYLKKDDVLERETFNRVLRDRNLVAYKHEGFWECMDTYKDNLRLNNLWDTDAAPWALWRRKGL
jgi:glucose-1-phosphate cytidylyltransferase